MDPNRKIIRSREQLVKQLSKCQRPLVFTNGCFDIIHRGHVDYLMQAATLGKFLLVGINSDESVRRLNKGADRPLNCLDDRMMVLASLGFVDGVVAFHDDTPLETIRLVKPNHLVKGGDWAVNEIVGSKFVLQIGGEIHSIPFRYPNSTSDLIRRIRATSAMSQ